jgi:hypothetical protein
MDGRALLSGWIRFFVGLIKATIQITSRGGVADIIVGLVALTLVATIVVIPLLVLSTAWVVGTIIATLRSRSQSDL